MPKQLLGSSAKRLKSMVSQGLWSNDTLHGLLAECVVTTPNNLALADQPTKAQLTGAPPLRLTYQELDAASDNLTSLLLDKGITAGDIIVVQLPNIVELAVCYFAASKIGAVISPIPVQYGSHEISTIYQATQPALGISCSNFQSNNLSEKMQQVFPHTLTFGEQAEDIQLNTQPSPEAQQAINALQDNIDGNTVITLCWTSGTTGTPKGVPRTHNMWVATGKVIIESAQLQPGDTLLNPFPLVNMAAVGGFLFPCVQLGLSLVLHHPIDIPVFLKQLADEKVNFSIIPPALLNQMAKQQELWHQFDFSALRCIGSGSAPLSPWMIEIFQQDFGKDIINFYGSNEGISLINTPQVSADAAIRATMFPRFGVASMPWQGVCHDLVKSKVIDTDSGNEITEPGQAGELLFAGATIFDGYFDPENSINEQSIVDSSGYFHTGDLVEICAEAPNFYRIVGRCKDIINRGGMKISPTEIDILLEGYAGLAEAAVCAYNDDTLGEKICACLVIAGDSTAPSVEQLADYLLGQGLAKFKLPEKICVFKQLPRNPMGKVIRSELAQLVTEYEETPND